MKNKQCTLVKFCTHEATDEVMSHIKKCCSVGNYCEYKWTILALDGFHVI